MTTHTAAMNNYCTILALYIERRTADITAFISTLDDQEKAAMWLASLDVAAGLALEYARVRDGRSPEDDDADVPAWLRTIVAHIPDDEDGASTDDR